MTLPVPRHAGRLLAVLAATTAMGACAREPVAPVGAPGLPPRVVTRAEVAPLVAVATLLDSFAIGGVYTVLPRGGFWGRYARSPEKEQYAGTVFTHPTGLELPVGLPIRILAAGSYTSRATAAFQTEYCVRYGADPYCAVSAFTYAVHGLAPGPGVLRPYESGAGLRLAWSRTAGYYEHFYATHPDAEVFRGVVPAADTAARRELHFRRAGCCYFIPSGSAAWETYEGSWRFGAVPDDGGRAELGEAPVLRLQGPRTDGPMAAPATFTVTTTGGTAITATRWWFVRAANNTFDGEPVPMITLVMPWGTIQVPQYPDGQRTVFEEVTACAGQVTCTYRATVAGAVVVQGTLADGRVLAARNLPEAIAAPSLRIDSTYGPNAAHSFTSRLGESVIAVTAKLTNLPAGATVRWLVTDNPDARGVSSAGPVSGSNSLGFTSVPAQDSFARYEHPDSMTHKAPQPLSYRFVGQVVVGTNVVTADTSVATQSARDALRQEYLDYGLRLPSSSALRDTAAFRGVPGYSLAELNQGDHGWFALQDTLFVTLPATRQAFSTIMRRYGLPFTVTSVFRNPVHHRLHVPRTRQQRDSIATRSNHQYGVAIDISVPREFDALWWQLRVEGKRRGACIEPRRLSRRHIHLDWRPTSECTGQGW